MRLFAYGIPVFFGVDRNRAAQLAARRLDGRVHDRPQQVIGLPHRDEPVEVTGLLDLRDEGYGFLRLKSYLHNRIYKE